LIGVTGTNGKTTVTGMIAALLAAGGRRPGVIGTTGIFFAGQQWPNPLTTPDPIALHRYLSVMVESGCDSVVMEVSSHALMQHRTAGLSWAAAAFTNLSHDHLDYHGGLEAYFEAKCQLFVRERPAMAVLPLGDSHGRRLAAMCASDCRIIGFGLPETEDASGPHDLETDAGINLPPEWVAAHSVRCTWAGSDMMWRAPGLPTAVPLHVSVPGRLNVDNALCASAVAWGLGVAVADIQRGLASFQAPPGRLERIIAGQPFTVAVDFAHTPEALSKLLESVRPLTSHRIIVVFGCGGDRDPGKRAIMGAVAAVRADVAIITDDNPRGEPPWAIRRAIMDGAAHVANGAETLEMPGRGQAIETALAIARPGDTVLIAGKGHETVQISASGTRPFSDVEVARGALLRLGHGQS
jgi:UDP-N-acetylmuramoyl-L-alanyl-D-glutamate--2,6-diaminopimelate ligase